jgi:calcineurin-like phosphoesterase family protein
VGDVSNYNRQKTLEIVSQLNGTKILTRGNHDEGVLAMMARGFVLAVEAVVVRVPISGGVKNVMLTHYPKKVLPPEVDYIVHGHIHNSTSAQRALHVKEGEIVNIPSFNINASVEVLNYMPVPLDWLVSEHIRKMRKTGT